MRKILTAFLFTVLLVLPHQGKASTLSDFVAKIENLQSEIVNLKSRLIGQVGGGPTLSLKKGSTGPEVVALQEFLTEKGFYSTAVDGNFGNGTLSALNAYKVSMGFTTYGSTFGGSPSAWRVAGDPVGGTYVVTSSACQADFDGNGVVEVADFELLQANLTSEPTAQQMIFDIKANGVIDIYDIKEWMSSYGRTNFCMSSDVTTSEWLASVQGTTVNPPAPSAVPAGSDWTAELAGASSEYEWLWDYQVKKIITYSRRQINTSVGGSTPSPKWIVNPVATQDNITALAQHFKSYGSVEMNNGKLYLVQHVGPVASYTGLMYESITKVELYKPNASENQTTSIDVGYKKVGDTLQGTTYINKKPLSAYNDTYPKFFNYFSTDAKWMMTMRVLNDGPIDNSSILGVYDNNPESAYTFATIGDSRLESINIVQGSSSFNPTIPQHYYNPTTNTITLKPNQGQTIWFHLFMKPPSVFPTGFTGISETKTFGTDFALNLQRNKAVIKNGDFVSFADQGITPPETTPLVCTPANPIVTTNPTTPVVTPGGTYVTVPVTITNNDSSDCYASMFDVRFDTDMYVTFENGTRKIRITSVLPSNNTFISTETSFSTTGINPGESFTKNVYFRVDQNFPAGTYQIGIKGHKKTTNQSTVPFTQFDMQVAGQQQAPVCTASNPVVTIAPSSVVSGGQRSQFSFSVKNNDTTGCAPSSFNLNFDTDQFVSFENGTRKIRGSMLANNTFTTTEFSVSTGSLNPGQIYTGIGYLRADQYFPNGTHQIESKVTRAGGTTQDKNFNVTVTGAQNPPSSNPPVNPPQTQGSNTCVRNAPTVTPSGVIANHPNTETSTKAYQVSITNNDTVGCSNSTFKMVVTDSFEGFGLGKSNLVQATNNLFDHSWTLAPGETQSRNVFYRNFGSIVNQSVPLSIQVSDMTLNNSTHQTLNLNGSVIYGNP